MKLSELTGTDTAQTETKTPETETYDSNSFDPIIKKASKQYGVPEALLKGMIHQESSWNPRATTPKSSAKGLMQLIDDTAAEMGVEDPFDPVQNIMGGAKYLKQQHDKFGTWGNALGAYYAGPTNYSRIKAGEAESDPELAKLVKDTNLHVSRVAKYAKQYKEQTAPVVKAKAITDIPKFNNIANNPVQPAKVKAELKADVKKPKGQSWWKNMLEMMGGNQKKVAEIAAEQLKGVGVTYQYTDLDMDKSRVWADIMMNKGEVTPENEAKLNELNAQMQRLEDEVAQAPFMADAVGSLLPFVKESMLASGKGGLVGAGIGLTAAAAVEAIVPTVGEGMALAPGLMKLGATAMATNETAQNMLWIEAGSFYEKARAMGMDHEYAKPAAMIYGGGAAGLETMKLKYLGKLIPGSRAVANKIIKNGFVRALDKGMMSRIGKDLVSTTMGEAGVEVSQQFLDNLTMGITEELHDRYKGTDISPDNMAEWAAQVSDGLVETFIKSAAGMGIISIPGVSINVMTEGGKKTVAKQYEEALTPPAKKPPRKKPAKKEELSDAAKRAREAAKAKMKELGLAEETAKKTPEKKETKKKKEEFKLPETKKPEKKEEEAKAPEQMELPLGKEEKAEEKAPKKKQEKPKKEELTIEETEEEEGEAPKEVFKFPEPKDKKKDTKDPETKEDFQELAGKDVKVDALGEEDSTTPADQVQVTVIEGEAKGNTWNIPKKDFADELKKRKDEYAKSNKGKKELSPREKAYATGKEETEEQGKSEGIEEKAKGTGAKKETQLPKRTTEELKAEELEKERRKEVYKTLKAEFPTATEEQLQAMTDSSMERYEIGKKRTKTYQGKTELDIEEKETETQVKETAKDVKSQLAEFEKEHGIKEPPVKIKALRQLNVPGIVVDGKTYRGRALNTTDIRTNKFIEQFMTSIQEAKELAKADGKDPKNAQMVFIVDGKPVDARNAATQIGLQAKVDAVKEAKELARIESEAKALEKELANREKDQKALKNTRKPTDADKLIFKGVEKALRNSAAKQKNSPLGRGIPFEDIYNSVVAKVWERLLKLPKAQVLDSKNHASIAALLRTTGKHLAKNIVKEFYGKRADVIKKVEKGEKVSMDEYKEAGLSDTMDHINNILNAEDKGFVRDSKKKKARSNATIMMTINERAEAARFDLDYIQRKIWRLEREIKAAKTQDRKNELAVKLVELKNEYKDEEPNVKRLETMAGAAPSAVKKLTDKELLAAKAQEKKAAEAQRKRAIENAKNRTVVSKEGFGTVPLDKEDIPRTKNAQYYAERAAEETARLEKKGFVAPRLPKVEQKQEKAAETTPGKKFVPTHSDKLKAEKEKAEKIKSKRAEKNAKTLSNPADIIDAKNKLKDIPQDMFIATDRINGKTIIGTWEQVADLDKRSWEVKSADQAKLEIISKEQPKGVITTTLNAQRKQPQFVILTNPDTKPSKIIKADKMMDNFWKWVQKQPLFDFVQNMLNQGTYLHFIDGAENLEQLPYWDKLNVFRKAQYKEMFNSANEDRAGALHCVSELIDGKLIDHIVIDMSASEIATTEQMYGTVVHETIHSAISYFRRWASPLQVKQFNNALSNLWHQNKHQWKDAVAAYAKDLRSVDRNARANWLEKKWGPVVRDAIENNVEEIATYTLSDVHIANVLARMVDVTERQAPPLKGKNYIRSVWDKMVDIVRQHIIMGGRKMLMTNQYNLLSSLKKVMNEFVFVDGTYDYQLMQKRAVTTAKGFKITPDTTMGLLLLKSQRVAKESEIATAPLAPGEKPTATDRKNYFKFVLDKTTGAVTSLRDWLDIESPWKAMGAYKTGSVLKRYYSKKTKYEEMGVKKVQAIIDKYKETTGGFNEAEFLDVLLAEESPRLTKRWSPMKRAKLDPIRAEFRKFFDDMEQIYKDRGVHWDWKKRRLMELEQKVLEATDFDKRNKWLRQLNTLRASNYVHIPVKLIVQDLLNNKESMLKKTRKNKPAALAQQKAFLEKANNIVNARKRVTLSLGEILEKYNMGADEISPTEILMNYIWRYSQDMANLDIRDAMVEDGLAIKNKGAKKKKPTKKQRGDRKFEYISLKEGMKISGFSQYWVETKALATFMQLRAVKEQQTKWERMLSWAKMGAFYNPFFLPIYDTYQSFMSGAWLRNPLKMPGSIALGIYHTIKKDDYYLEAMDEGLFSKPFDMPWDDFRHKIKRMAKYGHKPWLSRQLNAGLYHVKQLSNPARHPIKSTRQFLELFYQMSWHSAWWADSAIRMTTYTQLRKTGMSASEAASLAARFHGDYASVPPATRRKLNKFLFTPTFKIAMTKLYGDIITAPFKVALRKGGTKVDRQYTMGLIASTAAVVGFDYVMRSMGYEPEDDKWYNFGRRYTKIDENDDGSPREFVFTWSNPGNLMQRYFHRAITSYKRSGGSLPLTIYNTLRWDIHPVWSSLASVLTNTKPDGTPIFYEHDDKIDKVWKPAMFMLKNIVRLLEAPGDLLTPEPITSQSKQDLDGYLNSVLYVLTQLKITAIASIYTRNPKNIRLYQEFNAKLNVYRYNQKKYMDEHGDLNLEWEENFMDDLERYREEMLDVE